MSIGQFAFMYASTAYICLLNKEEVGWRKKSTSSTGKQVLLHFSLSQSKSRRRSVGAARGLLTLSVDTIFFLVVMWVNCARERERERKEKQKIRRSDMWTRLENFFSYLYLHNKQRRRRRRDIYFYVRSCRARAAHNILIDLKCLRDSNLRVSNTSTELLRWR